MKKLFFLLLFSTSLASFSQVADATDLRILHRNPDGTFEIRRTEVLPLYCNTAGVSRIVTRPDTLRAICLITLGYRQMGIAHARIGYVVVQPGKRPVYLDCRKQALKWPQVGWGYEVVGGKEK